MDKDPFKEYIKQSEPSRRDKGYVWHTAIGLQAVDGLRPSQYLIDTAIKNIEGDISIDEAQELLYSYYVENPKSDDKDRTEEADKVAVRIVKILSEQAFSFTPNEYISIHKKLFMGIYSHAGKIRDYNITKKEWVLDGATVLYGSASELRATLDYDFSEEKKFSYKNLSMDEIIHHLAIFISRLWQIHIFGEGNTRTVAVFFIKYLRTLGFDATNDIFAENAWYFRNALVRANYNDLRNGIHETTEFLEFFLRNLLLDERNELHNRAMHISSVFSQRVEDNVQSANLNISKCKNCTLEENAGRNVTKRYKSNDNMTPINAKEYDSKINDTIPYYEEFYKQTLSVIELMEFSHMKWLDLGCGTGTLERKAAELFKNVRFTMVDPSEMMLEKAREKNPDIQADYVCASSDEINYENEFNVVTAIQSHHYMQEDTRKKATSNVYNALCTGGIYLTFENVVPESTNVKQFELQRWGRYQLEHGKSKEEVETHIARCGVNYFPLMMNQHVNLLKEVGFKEVHVFWYSYMQMGIYAIK